MAYSVSYPLVCSVMMSIIITMQSYAILLLRIYTLHFFR